MSSEAVHKACEFGANANDRIGIAWPSNEWSNLLASISNMFTKPSIEPHAKYLPSGLLIMPYWNKKKNFQNSNDRNILKKSCLHKQYSLWIFLLCPLESCSLFCLSQCWTRLLCPCSYPMLCFCNREKTKQSMHPLNHQNSNTNNLSRVKMGLKFELPGEASIDFICLPDSTSQIRITASRELDAISKR